jgi:hypothetical protein
MLHALLQDIFVRGPGWLEAGERESRTDSYATGMWLFGEGAFVRKSAGDCLKRLQAIAARAG